MTLVLIFDLLLGCKDSNKSSDVGTGTNNTMVLNERLSVNEQWMQAINNKDLATLKKLYEHNAYGLSPNGIDFSNRDTLVNIVARNNFVVKDVRTVKRIKANNEFDYEIGSFKNAAGDLMKHLIIWNTTHETDNRVLEFLAEADDFPLDLKQIDAQREKWIELCNAHNAKALIDSLYCKNTMYYNHKSMIMGSQNLIANYAYMNSKAYQLTLKPILVEPVSETIVYEIGECEGSYNGKYVLIWQKDADVWQILFDSNI